MVKRYRKYAPEVRQIPPGAVKFAPKVGDVAAYVWDKDGRFYAKVYYGQSTKPKYFYHYRAAIAREKFIAGVFEGAKLAAEAKAKRAAEAKAWINPYKVGDVLKGSWGYDQTNVDFFEVVGVSGKMLSIRELAQERSGDGYGGSSKCVPMIGEYKSDVYRIRAQELLKSPIHGYLSLEKPMIVAGVPVYAAAYWSDDR
jgi:hypothetical protein